MNTKSPSVSSRWLASALLLATAGNLASGQADTLTREQVRDGWIRLFDGETLFGWQPRGDAEWSIEDGTIVAKPGSGIGFLATTTEFADFRLKADFWVDADANSGVFLRCPTEGAITDVNAYEVNIADVHEQWPTGSINRVGRTTGTPATIGHWNTYDLSAEGDRLIVRLNGEVVLDAKDDRLARGCLALQYRGAGQVKFRNVILQPRGLKSIFNGKDLTGWNMIPDRKSVYSVTPEGWLNVRNGNGDLQSEGRYGDFVFQLDIISNGEHLNSGVFFRALPGQFWSGYESQIRNQWQGDDRTQPVDYGTGGIYNRQPARKVVSSDHEWFTKTIVAHGRHLAVWINGYQVSDWTDPRSPNENARQGYRAEPGVLSLQGHDPTTDLSFRHLRIADMPPAR